MTTLDGGVIIKKGEGGGAIINNQDKVVDITENGTTEVVADGGFTGLGKVTINTEVSGGGGTPDTPSGGSMEYVVFNAETDLITFGEFLGMFGYLVKFPNKIEPIGLMLGMGETVNDAIAFAIDPTTEVDFQGERKSVREWGIALGADLDTHPRITKEQFYDLNA